MIHTLQRADVEAVQDDLTFQFVPVLLNMVVLNHDDYHINIVDELVEVVELILCYLVVFQEWVVALEGAGQMALLKFEHLQRGRFAVVVHILLVGKTIEADLAVVRDVVLLHDFMDAVENELRLAVVGLHGFVYHLGQTGIVAHKEPGVN